MKRLLFALWILATFSAFSASPIEGEWQVYGDGARLRFAASRGTESVFDIIWIDGPDLTVLPGTVVGSASETPSVGVYDCKVATDPRGKADKKRYARFVIKIDADTGDSFTFAPYEQGVKFVFQALLPYWWRRPIKSVDTRPSNLDGARRVNAPKPFVEL